MGFLQNISSSPDITLGFFRTAAGQDLYLKVHLISFAGYIPMLATAESAPLLYVIAIKNRCGVREGEEKERVIATDAAFRPLKPLMAQGTR